LELKGAEIPTIEEIQKLVAVLDDETNDVSLSERERVLAIAGLMLLVLVVSGQ
jgi:hypothetical protein